MSDQADLVRRTLDGLNKVLTDARDGKTTKGGFDLLGEFTAAIGAVALSTATLVLDIDARLEKLENETRHR